MKNRYVFYILGGTFLILLLVGILSVLLGGSTAYRGEKIAVVEVKGTIVGGESGSKLFGDVMAGSETLMRQIRDAAEDSSIKAVLLHINSPGGSSPASEAVYREILRFRERTDKPILAVMEDVAASGGYYIALGAEKIFANPATMTGSIGVIMQFTNYTGLYEKYGLDMVTIKSGKYKDIGNPAREMTQEERRLLQAMVDQIYGRFVDAVVEQRDIERERVLELAQGQIYTGLQAKDLGLIDYLGNFWDAVDYLAKVAKISGKPVLSYYSQQTLWERIFGSVVRACAKTILAGLGHSVGEGQMSDLMWIERSLENPGLNNLRIQ